MINIDKPGMTLCRNLWLDEINGNDEIGDGTYEKPFKTMDKLIHNLDIEDRKEFEIRPRILDKEAEV